MHKPICVYKLKQLGTEWSDGVLETEKKIKEYFPPKEFKHFVSKIL